MYVCNFDGRYIFNLQWSRKKNHTALTGHLAEKQIQGAHINLKSLFSCGYKCCCLTACETFSPFAATLEHYDACSRKDLAERKKKTLQRNMFAFLQHNTGMWIAVGPLKKLRMWLIATLIKTKMISVIQI